MTGRVWLAIVLGGAVTYAARATFFLFADQLDRLGPEAREALRMIPAAVLAALSVPAILRPDGAVDAFSPELLAGVVAALAAWRWRRLMVTILVGVVAVAGFRALLG
jgi:branched-subunit amino acid transport protein